MTEPILIKKGDSKVLLNGEPPKADCRVISEENYQRLKAGQHETIVMLPYVAKKIIEARDAHVRGDYEDVWHALYSIASPDFSSLEPWAELEELAEKAT